jgi:hypothetical protein
MSADPTPATTGGDPQPLADLLAGLHGLSPLVGVLAMALAFLPLFYGWRLIRWSTAVMVALIAGLAVLQVCLPRTEPLWAWLAALCVAALAGLLGFIAFQALVAVQAAGTAFLLVATGMAQLAPGWPLATFTVAALAAGAGGLLGWLIAPYIAIVQTVLYGAGLLLAGMVILCQPRGDGELLLLAAAVILLALPAGLFVQVRQLGKTAGGGG